MASGSFVTMMTSSNANIFLVTGHLCGEFTGPRWIPHTKASDAELWCFLWYNKRLSKQWWGWWFETQSCPICRHRNGHDIKQRMAKLILTHIYISKLCIYYARQTRKLYHHWFGQCLVACSVPSNYSHQCWIFLDWIIGTKNSVKFKTKYKHYHWRRGGPGISLWHIRTVLKN